MESDEPAQTRGAAPACPGCGAIMRFEGGQQTHDLWAERFICEVCGREVFRSYGRGSV